ncbi:DUF2793 domain-containing protein [Parasphingorhabdus sp.]|uniref:DUF2793 domain-containing protein n=1 Tax=Parasphingorhabdus sp. TaxID=2709688 RepID=UPI003A916AF9
MTILETARFRLALLSAGQAHKELFHNEALARLDFLIHPTVQAIETDPATVVPVPGQSWLVGPGAVNDWFDHDNQIAGWTENGWLFISPIMSMRVFVESSGCFVVFNDSWHLADAIGSPVGGAVVDTEARVAIDSILAALRVQGIFKPGP